MPQSDQTPARKRFLAPSRTQSTQKESHYISSVKTQRYNNSVQFSSSPFARTPFASRGTLGQDEDIDTPCEGGEESSPLVQSVDRRPHSIQRADLIEVDSQSIADDTAIVSDNIQADSDGRNDSADHPYQSFPITKRRKLSHASPQVKNADFNVCHDSVTRLDDYDSQQENERLTAEDDTSRPKSSDELTPSSPDVEIETPKQSSRFRVTTSTSTIPLGSKLSFQAGLSSMQRGAQPLMENTLPDAFSPSRRKSGHDYIHGGMASTVRKWVLELAAEESRVSSKEQSHLRFQVAKVTKDPNGRFVMIEDQTNKLWLLPCAQQTRISRPSSASELQRIKIGSEIRLKGGQGSCWDLPFSASDSNDDESLSRSCTVAVLWDVIS